MRSRNAIGEIHVIDARLGNVFVDAVEEVHRVAIDLEFHEIVAEQTAQHVLVRSGGKQTKNVRRRKGNVPELMDEQRRLHRAQILGGEREVVVLNPRHRSAGAPLRFVGHGVREAQVHRLVSLPVLGAILEVLDEHVTERPQRSIREAVVVAVHVGFVEPHAAERVAVFARAERRRDRFRRRLRDRRCPSPTRPRCRACGASWDRARTRARRRVASPRFHARRACARTARDWRRE